MPDIILKIQPSKGRRLLSIVVLTVSALIMLDFAVTDATQAFALKFILFAMAAVFLWQAFGNYRFMNAALILTREGLFDDNGTLICSLSNIAQVDRGWFSFKPSNGFLLRLHKPEDKKWSPGLYWRFGRRLGVGGSISPAQTKALSDKLILLMQENAHGVELL